MCNRHELEFELLYRLQIPRVLLLTSGVFQPIVSEPARKDSMAFKTVDRPLTFGHDTGSKARAKTVMVETQIGRRVWKVLRNAVRFY
jgi:hypothetical protein